MYSLLLRGAILLGGAWLTKEFMSRWASKGFDIDKTLSQLGGDIEKFVEKIKAQGEDTFDSTKTIFSLLNSLTNKEFQDIDGLVELIQKINEAEANLPETVKTMFVSTLDLEARIGKILNDSVEARAISLIGEKEPNGELSDFLRRKYLGLFLLGRCGKQLPNSELDGFTTTLRHFHEQLDRPEDAHIIKWYTTIGLSNGVPLNKILISLPEVVDLEINPDFIAFALGQELELEFDNLLETLVEMPMK